MKRKFKLISIIALVLAIIMIIEVPANALQAVSGNNSSSDDISSEELDSSDSSEANILMEVEDERSEYSKTFLLDNGNNLLVDYSVPIHYMNDNKWIDYDNTLTEDKRLVTKQPERKAEITENADSIEHTESETIFDNEQSLSTENTSDNTNNNENRANESNTVQTEHVKSNGETPIASTVSQENNEPTEEIKTYSNKNSNLAISFSKNTSEYSLVFVGENEKAVSWGYKDANKVNAEYIEDKTEYEGNEKFTVLKNLISTVKYKSVYKDIDLELISSPVGVKENIIVNTKDATNRFVCEYDIGNLTPKRIDDRSIALYNANDEIEYYINAEYMYDAKGNTSNDLKLNIIDSVEGKLSVELIADSDWLYDSSRSYPVVIDPSFLTSQEWSSVQSTYIYDYTPNTCYGYGSSGYRGSLYTGKDNHGTLRSLIKMNNIPALNKGDMIIDATMNLYLYNGMPGSTLFSDTEYVGAYEAMTPWNQSTATWNNCHDYYSKVIDYVKYDTSTEPGWVTFNITKLFKGWFEGLRDNNGIMLKSLNENSCTQCAAYFSASYPSSITPRPVFQITYRNNKGIEDYWSNTTINVGTAGTLYVNDYSGALTFTTHIASTASPAKTSSIEYVYNSYLAGVKLEDYTPYIGRGWRMNLFQTLYPSSKYGLTGESAEKYPYVFTDADGTEHYFRKVTENNQTKYLDEDGLNLELTIKGSGDWSDNTLESYDYYVITDKDKNRITFFSDGSLRTQKNSYNQKSQQRYNAPDSDIKWVEDPSDNKIKINHKNDCDYVTEYLDADDRTISIDYATFGDTTACLKRIYRTDNTYIEFSYYSNGLLESITDVDGYKIEINYQNSAVSEIIEKGTTGSEGNKITFDRSQYNTTVKKTSGNDGIMDTSDDITTTYQFDNCGRTKSVQTETENEEDLGAANYEYTSGTPNSSGSNINKLNRITSEHAVGANTYNYLKNHGFETSSGWTNADWHDSNTFTGTYDQSQKAFGKKSYKIQSTSYNNTSAGRAYQDITTLNPGSTYTLSGYIKVTELSGNQNVSGAVIDATSFNQNSPTTDCYSEYITEVTDPAINNGWRRVSITFTVPTDSECIRINIALRAATGTAYFDGIQLEKAKTAGSYNLLENSSFEASESNSRPLSWNNYVNMSFSWSSANDGCRTTQKRHASQSFKINGEVQKNKYISQIVPVSGTENDTYIVGGWAKADSVALDNNNVRKFKISIDIHYSDGSDTFKESADFNPTISGWQFVSKAFTLSDETSANKTPVSIEIFLNYSKQGNAAYFDNISLVKEPSQSYTYDSKGNLVSVVSNAEQSSTMEYNGDNQLTKAVDAKGYEYTYSYNEKGKVSEATTQLGSKYRYEYDDCGNVKAVEGESKFGNYKVRCEETIGYDDAQSSDYYDVITYDQRQNTSKAVYDSKTGTLKSATDNTGVVTDYEYQPSNDVLTSVTKHKDQSVSPSEPTEPTDATEPTEAVSYQYSGTNNLTNYKYLTDINSSTTHYHFDYDEFGNKTSTKVGERTLADYAYNGSGSLSEMHYGNGDSVSYEYDKYGNICKKTLNAGPASIPSYEAFADNTGAITKAIDNENHLQYDDVYDSTDRLINSTITDTSTNKRKAMYEYDFDLNNNISKFAVLTPNGSNTTTYTYRENNLFRNATLQNGSTVDFSYDYLGRANKTTLNIDDNTHIENRYTYLDSPLSGYTTTILETETIGDIKYKYEYDRNGNITKISKRTGTDNNGNDTYTDCETYIYDYLGQLKQVDYLLDQTRVNYEYSNGGNLASERISDTSGSTPVSISTNTYSYGDNSWGDLLTVYNNNTITYDGIGNPLNYRDGISFTWSNGRQLQSYTKNNSTINYTYDSSGMRLSKDVGNTHYTYLYQNGLLVQETIGEKILDYSYSAGGQPLSVRYRTNSNDQGSYYYYAINSRGDVIGLYNDVGALCAYYSYDVWGNPIAVTDASGSVISNPNDFANIQSLRYRSYYYDTDTGFYYLQNRFYDPVTHRFINEDSFVSTGYSILGHNMFLYGLNNPVNTIDSNGTDAVLLCDTDSVSHVGALIQDANNNWWHFYWGTEGLSSRMVCLLGIDVVPFTWCESYTGDISLDGINADNTYSGDYEDMILLIGDFSSSVLLAQNPEGLYNLYSNNCSQKTMTILSSSNTIYSNNLKAEANTLVPKEAFNNFKRNESNRKELLDRRTKEYFREQGLAVLLRSSHPR